MGKNIIKGWPRSLFPSFIEKKGIQCSLVLLQQCLSNGVVITSSIPVLAWTRYPAYIIVLFEEPLSTVSRTFASMIDHHGTLLTLSPGPQRRSLIAPRTFDTACRITDRDIESRLSRRMRESTSGAGPGSMAQSSASRPSGVRRTGSDVMCDG